MSLTCLGLLDGPFWDGAFALPCPLSPGRSSELPSAAVPATTWVTASEASHRNSTAWSPEGPLTLSYILFYLAHPEHLAQEKFRDDPE